MSLRNIILVIELKIHESIYCTSNCCLEFFQNFLFEKNCELLGQSSRFKDSICGDVCERDAQCTSHIQLQIYRWFLNVINDVRELFRIFSVSVLSEKNSNFSITQQWKKYQIK